MENKEQNLEERMNEAVKIISSVKAEFEEKRYESDGQDHSINLVDVDYSKLDRYNVAAVMKEGFCRDIDGTSTERILKVYYSEIGKTEKPRIITKSLWPTFYPGAGRDCYYRNMADSSNVKIRALRGSARNLRLRTINDYQLVAEITDRTGNVAGDFKFGLEIGWEDHYAG